MKRNIVAIVICLSVSGTYAGNFKLFRTMILAKRGAVEREEQC